MIYAMTQVQQRRSLAGAGAGGDRLHNYYCTRPSLTPRKSSSILILQRLNILSELIYANLEVRVKEG